jgi:hypothetical protein
MFVFCFHTFTFIRTSGSTHFPSHEIQEKARAAEARRNRARRRSGGNGGTGGVADNDKDDDDDDDDHGDSPHDGDEPDAKRRRDGSQDKKGDMDDVE